MQKAKFKSYGIYLLLLLTLAIALLFNRQPNLTEKLYSNGLYPIIAGVVSNLSSPFPFSISDVLYMGLVLLLPALVLMLVLKKISTLKALKYLGHAIALTIVIFYWFWGFNYFRASFNDRLAIKSSTPNTEEFTEVFESLIVNTNNNYTTFDNFNKQNIDSLVEQAYEKQASLLKIDYPMGKRKAKPISFSRFFAASSISGYFGPYFNEVHVNKHVLPVQYPMILAHEKAHQFGITSEAEANFYAWLACSSSNSKHLRYSANLFALRYFAATAKVLKDYDSYISTIKPEVFNDYNHIREHWAKLKIKSVDELTSKVYDTYLKTNQVAHGINDYHGVVQYIMDYSSR